MLSDDEKKREMQQWGIIFNLTRQRKKLSEIKPSNDARNIEKILDKIEDKIKSLRISL